MGMKSRRKGKLGELEAAAEVRRLFQVDACRGVQRCGGPDAPDISTAIEGVHFEVKRCERLLLSAAVEQASRDAGPHVPVVLHRSNRRPWLATVPLEDLPRLATQIYLTLAQQA